MLQHLAALDFLYKLGADGNQVFFVRIIWLSIHLDIKRLILLGFRGVFRPGLCGSYLVLTGSTLSRYQAGGMVAVGSLRQPGVIRV